MRRPRVPVQVLTVCAQLGASNAVRRRHREQGYAGTHTSVGVQHRAPVALGIQQPVDECPSDKHVRVPVVGDDAKFAFERCVIHRMAVGVLEQQLLLHGASQPIVHLRSRVSAEHDTPVVDVAHGVAFDHANVPT